MAANTGDRHMTDANEQSIPSRGSRGEPVAYYVRGSEYDTGCEFSFVTLSRGHAEAAGGTVKTLVRLTDEERTFLRMVRDTYAMQDDDEVCGMIAASITGLLDRTK
jgi:hypothetical protein